MLRKLNHHLAAQNFTILLCDASGGRISHLPDSAKIFPTHVQISLGDLGSICLNLLLSEALWQPCDCAFAVCLIDLTVNLVLQTSRKSSSPSV